MKKMKPLRSDYYTDNGVKDGLQQKWHFSGVLAEEKEYEKGQLLRQKVYNKNGVMVNDFADKVDTVSIH